MARTTGTHTKATGTLTVTGNFSDNDTFLLGGVTYRFKTTPAQANDIDIAASAELSLANAVLAINGTGTPGATTYFTGTSAQPALIASNTATVLTVTARVGGSHANGIDFREGVDGGTTFSVTRAISGGAGALHTFLTDLRSNLNQANSEIISEIDHALNAANGA
jgi:hypothetical protein